MDSETDIMEDKSIENIFEAGTLESSEDPPMEEWASLEIVCEETNPKRLLYEEGFYDPGPADICAKYIAQSASSVIRHPYYCYPAVPDPGIMTALLKPEEPILFPDDGQELYLAICSDMNLCPIRCFYRGLLEDNIDLRYYGINPKAFRAIGMALKYNKFVKLLDFTDNFLNVDACYHLGDMLSTNSTLVELNLSGCRIGPIGVQQLLANVASNRSLKTLNLSRNGIGDEGMLYFANAVFKGLDVRMIDLSYNNISGQGVRNLVEPFETNNKLTHWILSWNNLFSPGTFNFLNAISETSKTVEEMDLSWNSLTGPRIAIGIKNLLTVRALKHLDLSNNNLEGESMKIICSGLSKAKRLTFLNLSNNPLTPQDVLYLLKKLKLRTVKIQHVLLDNININAACLRSLKEVQSIKPKLIFTYGMVVGAFKSAGPDVRELLLNRLEYLCKKPKKKKTDIALVVLQIKKDNISVMDSKNFHTMVTDRGAPVDTDLIDELSNVFPGPRAGKGEKTLNIGVLAEYIARKWPDRKLPPTPPPEPEPEPEPEPVPEPVVKGKGKGKGKK